MGFWVKEEILLNIIAYSREVEWRGEMLKTST